MLKGKQNTNKQTSYGPSNKGSSNKAAGQQVTATASDDFESSDRKAHCDPVTYWVRYDKWPSNFGEKDFRMAKPPPRKRQRVTSYSQDVRDGKSSEPYSSGYQKEMTENGMIMDSLQRQTTITDDSKQLCMNLLNSNYQSSTDFPFRDGYFEAVIKRAQDRNEARIIRDILPFIVPSAELLHIRENGTDPDDEFRNITEEVNVEGAADFKDNLRDIIEEVNAEWTKSGVIYGPRPRPDFAAGLASSAFTHDEIRQLKCNHTDRCPSYMTEDMYFPFLICEVKSSKGLLVEAERQTMHSASIAARAIIELYRKASREQELDRKILVISISLDHSMVSLYGHYARVTGQDLLFFRYEIDSFCYAQANDQNRWKAYNFTRRVYDHFVPIHLDRIRSALLSLNSLLPESAYEANSNNSTEAPESQALLASMPPSQAAGLGKEPSLLSTVLLQSENSKLRKEVSSLIRQQQERERQQQEQISNLQALLLQQKGEEKKQAEEQRKQVEMMKEQMNTIAQCMETTKQQNDGKKETGGEQ